ELSRFDVIMGGFSGFVTSIPSAVSGFIFGDRTRPPRVKDIRDITTTSSMDIEANSRLINNYLAQMLSSHEENKQLVEELSQREDLPHNGIFGNLNGWSASTGQVLDRLASGHDRDGFTYFGHNQDGSTTTYEHRHRIWKRAERGGKTEEWVESMAHFKAMANDHPKYHLRYGRTLVEGFEAGSGYVEMTRLKKLFGISPRFFRRKVTNQGQTFTYGERGFTFKVPKWKYNPVNRKAEFTGYREITVFSYKQFNSIRMEFYKEHSLAFGLKKNIKELIADMGPTSDSIERIKEYWRRGILSPKYTFVDEELSRGAIKRVLFPIMWAWDLGRAIVLTVGEGVTGTISQLRGFVRGVKQWYWSTRTDGGQVVDQANLQSANRLRLRFIYNTLLERQSRLGYKLNKEEQELAELILEVLSDPRNAPNTGSVSFMQRTLLKDERGAARSNAIFGSNSVSTQSASRLNNDGFHIERENVESASHKGFWRRVREKWAGSALILLTLSGGAIWNLDRITFFITENPKVQYVGTLTRETADYFFVEYLNLPTTPELFTQLKSSLRPWALNNSDMEHVVKFRLGRYSERARNDPEYNPLMDPEFHADVERILKDEVLAVRQDLSRALIFAHVQKTLKDQVVPLTVSEEMEKAFVAKYLEQAEAIESVFAEFRRPIYNPESGQSEGYNMQIGKNAVKAAQLDGLLSQELYSDLIWYFHYGYASSIEYYYTIGANSLLTTEGGAYESFGQAPGILKALPEGTIVYNHKREDQTFEVLETQKLRTAFIVASDEITGFSQIEFIDEDLPPLNTPFLFVKTEDLE
ncbi:MAG: hypothetical protein AAF202_00535, partial [Pseudomonadota bacterium]